MKNDHNALIDVKMNYNYDVHIFKRGRRATFIPGPTSIPDSRVFRTFTIVLWLESPLCNYSLVH